MEYVHLGFNNVGTNFNTNIMSPALGIGTRCDTRALGLFSEVAAQLNGTRDAHENSGSADQAPKSIPVVVENSVGVLSQVGGMFTEVLHPLGSTSRLGLRMF